MEYLKTAIHGMLIGIANAIPGIIVQLVLIPLLVMALKKAGVIQK